MDGARSEAGSVASRSSVGTVLSLTSLETLMKNLVEKTNKAVMMIQPEVANPMKTVPKNTLKVTIKNTMHDLSSGKRGHFLDLMDRMGQQMAHEQVIIRLEAWAATTRACLETLEAEVAGMTGPVDTSTESDKEESNELPTKPKQKLQTSPLDTVLGPPSFNPMANDFVMAGPKDCCKHQEQRVETVRPNIKRSEPPTFSGEITDFPEFKSRWIAIVSSCRLQELDELDRLKQAIPREEKDALFCVSTMKEAWEVLTLRYGNTSLIAENLKGSLKNLKLKKKLDHDRIIELHD